MNQTQTAYSLFQIKALDDDRRIITGLATSPEPDRVGDIVDSLGASFAKTIPLLWQHKHDMPIGEAQLSKPTKKGIDFIATVAKIEEDGPLKQMVDMAWQAIKAKLVKGVSIGFRPTKYDFMQDGGIKFLEYEIYELSAVTIPANAAATIQTIKALDYRSNKGGPVRLITRAAEMPRDPGAPIKLIAPSDAVRLLNGHRTG